MPFLLPPCRNYLRECRITYLDRFFPRKVRDSNLLDQIMSASNFNYLPRAMEAANIRQEVIAHNIANVNTPNYKKSNLVFEELLAKELYGDEPDGKLKMIRTHDSHLPAPNTPIVAIPTIAQDHQTLMRVDNNNVDIDIEMAGLAKNQIYFNALATQMSGYVQELKNVITSGQTG